MHRFFDEVVEARRWLEQGLLGRVLAARIRNATPGPDWGSWFYRKASVRNGVVDQLGVHGIDLVEHLLGRVVNVSARARIARPERELRDGTLAHVETIDNASATYELDDDTLHDGIGLHHVLDLLLRPVLPVDGELMARARVVHRGRTIAVVTCDIVRHPDGAAASDHLPVVVDIAT